MEIRIENRTTHYGCGGPVLVIIPQGDEVEIQENYEGYVFKGCTARLSPEALKQVRAFIPAPDEDPMVPYWGDRRPAVKGPHWTIRARYGEQKEWGDQTVDYGLDYAQWCSLRGY